MSFQWKIQQNNKPSRRRFFKLRSGESIDHVVLKLVGFILFFDFDPDVEKDVGWKYKPDLIAFSSSGDAALWVECADVAVKKIHRVLNKYKNARVVVLKLNRKDAEQFYGFFNNDGESPENLSVVGFDDDFLDNLCESIKDRIDIAGNLAGDNLSISWENFSTESRVYCYGADLPGVEP